MSNQLLNNNWLINKIEVIIFALNIRSFMENIKLNVFVKNNFFK